MSKELIERLRSEGDGVMSRREKVMIADRIEELERQLYAEKERCDRYMEDNKRLAGERDALQADNARLRAVLLYVRRTTYWQCYMDAIDPVLATTPKQSLTRNRNQVIESCILELYRKADKPLDEIVAAIRATKEPE